MMKLGKAFAAGLIGAGALALTATSASAYIVCNDDGACWHVHRHYDYPVHFGIVVHPDHWRWRHDRDDYYHWREHRGRGYWRNGVWITF